MSQEFKKDQCLEEISDLIRQGIPVSIMDAIAAIDYQTKKRIEQKKSFVNKLFAWIRG